MQVSRVIRQVARPLFSVAKPSFIIPAFSYSSKASSAFESAAKAAAEVLNNEIKFENEFIEETQSTTEEQSMQQYLKKNNFKLVERSGESLFILSKTHGDLQVNILCDARQVYMDEDRFEEELEENAEESVDGDAKHDLEKDDMEDGEEEDQPVLLRIEVINKANQKLTFDATLGQENVSINSLHATPADVEAPAEIPIMAVGTRKNAAFTGPNFLDLSEDMQESFNNYLVALGVDGSLFEALREHLTTKEHSEYVSWLNNVKNFISTK